MKGKSALIDSDEVILLCALCVFIWHTVCASLVKKVSVSSQATKMLLETLNALHLKTGFHLSSCVFTVCVFMHVRMFITAHNHLYCEISSALPYCSSHLFNTWHSPQTHGTLLSYELWVSVTQQCMACLFFLTSKSFSMPQFSSVLRQPLILDFSQNIVLALKGKEPSWLQTSPVSVHAVLKDAWTLELCTMCRTGAFRMIRSYFFEAWICFWLASYYRD